MVRGIERTIIFQDDTDRVDFLRRHRRLGHLFQNRYKSIVVEEEPYRLERIRYLHTPLPVFASLAILA